MDLEIYSIHDLQPLVKKLGKKVYVLYVGCEYRKFCAKFEVARHTTTADATIRAFCKMIRALPAAERKLWDSASVRSFSVGIEPGTKPGCTDFRIRPETVREVAELDAEIVLSIYSNFDAARGGGKARAIRR